jgi:hypothetical protein
LQHHWLPSLLCGSGGALLVACVTQPLARIGVGSATSFHEVFDLLLDGHLRLGIPRWVGLLGYVPAFGGVAILLAEATVGRLLIVLFLSGLVSSAVAVGLLAATGPWNHLDRLGLGLWLGIAGVAVATVGGLLDRLLLIRARKRRSPTTTKAGAHALSPVR